MEDDDEFGDLYTDVLPPFTYASAPSSSAPQPPHFAPAPARPSIDLNLNLEAPEIPSAARNPDSAAASYRSDDQIALPEIRESQLVATAAAAAATAIDRADETQVDEVGEAAAVRARVLVGGDLESAYRASSPDENGGKEWGSDGGDGAKGVDFVDKDVRFDIEEDEEAEGIGSEPVIPGLSSHAVGGGGGGDLSGEGCKDGGGGGGDDWDSDSEDDLQIVLNDDSHIAMETGGMVVGDDDDDDDDEDGGLVIVAGGDPGQGVEEQDWGENVALPGEGEKKDTGELTKAGGSVTALPKIGYSNHGYHPFHSQYKYVRPGAAPMPGIATSIPGGHPGQIRPLANIAGRGRGDWRPPGIKGAAAMQKGFHAGTGLPGWGNSAAGRGFGGGLEFTLPSHKSIFDVDIDSFEEKPWKYPNVDVSDFFNFGLNEDSWKDYCKQLEQLRLESTMQSKIRVYESGRTEQEFDPDLPPELAAATGIHDIPVENANSAKSDVGQSDVLKGSGRMRPSLPTGRAIQVEGGCGERLPSIDTRPPRIRDSDAIIEIVLQDTEDNDSSAGNGAQDLPEDGESHRDVLREDCVVGDEIPRLDSKYLNGFPPNHNGQNKELAGRRMPFMKSCTANIPNGDENLFFPQEEPIKFGSRGQNPMSYGVNFASSCEKRKMQTRVCDQSPPNTPNQDLTTDGNQKEESVESMRGKCSAPISSLIKDGRESSVEDRDTELEDTVTADGNARLENDEIDSNTMDKVDSLMDGTPKRQILTSQAEQPSLEEVDDREDSKPARSSDNSKARSASSKENRKRRHSFEEEVIQDPRLARLGSIRQQHDENDHSQHRRVLDQKQEPERNRMGHKGREGSNPYKDRHSGSDHLMHSNTDALDRQKDRDSFDMDWTQRDDDLYSRRARNDEPRKRDRGKVQENERKEKDDSLHSRVQLDNGTYRVPYNKDAAPRDSRHRERDDGLRIKYEAEDHHSKRRKGEEYLRREHIDKEEGLRGYRETSSRHRRERDEVLDPRKRDELQRSRDNLDQYAAKQKDESKIPRERDDRLRDREEWHWVKQSHEEPLPKREREGGRISVRSGRGGELKAWAGHVRVKDEHRVSEKEYQSRETIRHNDHLKKRDRTQDEIAHHKGRDDVYAHGSQYSNDQRRLRQERSSSLGDRVANALENHRVHERKHKEGTRKSKELDVSDCNSLVLSKRSEENHSVATNEKGLKGSGDEEHAEHEIPGHRVSRKGREDVHSDDEHQDSHRGRSKLERWTSHKERDFSISNTSSSSLQFKDIDNNYGSSEAGKPLDESAKSVDADSQHLLSSEWRDSAGMESNDADTKGLGDQQDRHLDTVERLKKRSERFKLPMPSEKEALAIKKLESEPLTSTKTSNLVDSEVKQERPVRKRRWISN